MFVSLKKDGQLRGCIGTIEPETVCVADEIIENAISPQAHTIHGSIRWPKRNWANCCTVWMCLESQNEWHPLRNWMQNDMESIVSKGWKRGLLLPNLDGVNTPEQQISIALKKAGIHPSEEYTIERFEVTRHR